MKKGSDKMFDYSKLEGRITEKFGSKDAFAKAYGKSPNTISRKLSGKIRINTDEIIRMSAPDLLDIPAEEYHLYFFKPKVQDVEH